MPLFELSNALLCTDGPVKTLAGLPLPRTADERLVLAVDVSNWLRPDANTSPERLFCHTYGRGRGSAQMIPPVGPTPNPHVRTGRAQCFTPGLFEQQGCHACTQPDTRCLRRERRAALRLVVTAWRVPSGCLNHAGF
ncbi:transposase [Streptomyces chartreusis]|uniref:transposase n=1 Tax=Streptomyces chartreusis TaxID=1969 RepID=UPI00380C142C